MTKEKKIDNGGFQKLLDNLNNMDVGCLTVDKNTMILITAGVYSRLVDKYHMKIMPMFGPVDNQYGEIRRAGTYKFMSFPEKKFNSMSVSKICDAIARKLNQQHRKYSPGMDTMYVFVLLFIQNYISDDFEKKDYWNINKIRIGDSNGQGN